MAHHHTLKTSPPRKVFGSSDALSSWFVSEERESDCLLKKDRASRSEAHTQGYSSRHATTSQQRAARCSCSLRLTRPPNKIRQEHLLTLEGGPLLSTQASRPASAHHEYRVDQQRSLQRRLLETLHAMQSHRRRRRLRDASAAAEQLGRRVSSNNFASTCMRMHATGCALRPTRKARLGLARTTCPQTPFSNRRPADASSG